MIVVGNPDILQTDPCWRALIEYCMQNGGYSGIEPKESVSADLNPNENLTLDFSALTIKTGKVLIDFLSFYREKYDNLMM